MRGLPEGTEVGRFRLLGAAPSRARGSTLYRATGPRGAVALKLLDVGGDSELRDRLLGDLGRYRQIQHRGLQPIYEVGRFGDSVYVATRATLAQTLAEVVRREGPLTEDRVAAIAEQAAEALAALHEGGIVHASVSPESLFVGESDEVVLLDPFGGAEADSDAEPGRVAIEEGYAPPELAPGEALRSPRTDVWGLGAVAYTALTGESPRTGRLLGSGQLGGSGDLEHLIGRAMATDPAARPSAAELAAELLPAVAGTGAAPEPPRRSYARLGAPRVVVCGEPFDVTLGLASRPEADVEDGELTLPDSVTGPYTLTIHLVAGGFSLVDGEDWTVELEVTAGKPYPTAKLEIVADQQEEPTRPLLLQALYSVGGQTIGRAIRPIAVQRDRDQPAPAPVPVEPGFEVWVPKDWEPTDLEAAILIDPSSPGTRLLWTFKTKHEDVETPKKQIASDIGGDPAKFAKGLVRDMPKYEGKPNLYDKVHGIGRRVADKVPDEMLELLAEVARRSAPRPPSVLLLSDEPFVPWELAVMDEPLDAKAPPFLAAQATVGRWVIGPKKRPRTPPPRAADADTIAVVSGKYELGSWKRLRQAEAEAEDLRSEYGALPVNASTSEVTECLRGKPQSDILHFAVHGRYDGDGIEDGIILVDGAALDPDVVRGQTFEPPRFVFLNACQLGSGYSVLGDYAGMAAAFLYAGAAAVVAPLWSIDDGLARGVAKDFYEAAFKGRPPAAFLRDERSSFARDREPESSIHMAYQFFGHPEMKLNRSMDADPA